MENEPSRNECIVCYESKIKEDFSIMEPCGHELCTVCMKEYLERHNYTCPMCRHPFETREHRRKLLPQHVSGLGSTPELVGLLIGVPMTSIGTIRLTTNLRHLVPQPPINNENQVYYFPLPEWRVMIENSFSIETREDEQDL